MINIGKITTFILSLGFMSNVYATDKSVLDTDISLSAKMTILSGNQMIGIVDITDNKYGVVFTPNLKGLSPGMHGFHVHENGSCDASMKGDRKILGGAAGGHYDPNNTKKHGTAWSDDSHKGDLPALYVGQDGDAITAVLAPRLTLTELKGKALMIHLHGDNHSDSPKPLGGGGSRVACGVIE